MRKNIILLTILGALNMSPVLGMETQGLWPDEATRMKYDTIMAYQEAQNDVEVVARSEGVLDDLLRVCPKDIVHTSTVLIHYALSALATKKNTHLMSCAHRLTECQTPQNLFAAAKIYEVLRAPTVVVDYYKSKGDFMIRRNVELEKREELSRNITSVIEAFRDVGSTKKWPTFEQTITDFERSDILASNPKKQFLINQFRYFLFGDYYTQGAKEKAFPLIDVAVAFARTDDPDPGSLQLTLQFSAEIALGLQRFVKAKELIQQMDEGSKKNELWDKIPQKFRKPAKAEPVIHTASAGVAITDAELKALFSEKTSKPRQTKAPKIDKSPSFASSSSAMKSMARKEEGSKISAETRAESKSIAIKRTPTPPKLVPSRAPKTDREKELEEELRLAKQKNEFLEGAAAKNNRTRKALARQLEETKAEFKQILAQKEVQLRTKQEQLRDLDAQIEHMLKATEKAKKKSKGKWEQTFMKMQWLRAQLDDMSLQLKEQRSEMTRMEGLQTESLSSQEAERQRAFEAGKGSMIGEIQNAFMQGQEFSYYQISQEMAAQQHYAMGGCSEPGPGIVTQWGAWYPLFQTEYGQWMFEIDGISYPCVY